MTVVSDTSVLIHLARIDRFSFLHRIYSEIIIPQEVWRETVEEGSERPGAPETRSARDAGWIEVAAVKSDTSVHQLLRRALNDGEAAVLALADRMEADLCRVFTGAPRPRHLPQQPHRAPGHQEAAGVGRLRGSGFFPGWGGQRPGPGGIQSPQLATGHFC